MLPKFAEITRGSCNFSSSSFSYFSFSFFSFFSFSFFSSFSPVTPGHPCHPGEPPRRPGCCYCCLLQMIIQTPEGPASCKWSSGRTVGLVRYWIRIRKLGIQFKFRYNQELFLCVAHPIWNSTFDLWRHLLRVTRRCWVSENRKPNTHFEKLGMPKKAAAAAPDKAAGDKKKTEKGGTTTTTGGGGGKEKGKAATTTTAPTAPAKKEKGKKKWFHHILIYHLIQILCYKSIQKVLSVPYFTLCLEWI